MDSIQQPHSRQVPPDPRIAQLRVLAEDVVRPAGAAAALLDIVAKRPDPRLDDAARCYLWEQWHAAAQAFDDYGAALSRITASPCPAVPASTQEAGA